MLVIIVDEFAVALPKKSGKSLFLCCCCEDEVEVEVEGGEINTLFPLV